MSFKVFKYKENPETLFLPITDEMDEFHIIHGGTRVAHFEPQYKRYDLPKGEKYIIIGKLSNMGDIKTQIIIDFDESDFEFFKTPKDKLIHLLYYGGIKTKAMVELHKPQINYWGVSDKDIDSYSDDMLQYEKDLQNSPDDYLVLFPIQKNTQENLEI